MIAIVGNGKGVNKYGDKIDASEKVIRFNHATVRGYREYVGYRIDILAVIAATKQAYQDEYSRIDKDLLTRCRKIIIVGNKVNKEQSKLFNQPIHMNYSCYYILCSVLGLKTNKEYLPSTGMTVLSFYLLKSNEKINVYNFDCFESGHYFDDKKRDNKCHDIQVEKALIEKIKANYDVKFFN